MKLHTDLVPVRGAGRPRPRSLEVIRHGRLSGTRHHCSRMGIALSWILWILLGILGLSALRFAVAPLQRRVRTGRPVSDAAREPEVTFAGWVRNAGEMVPQPRTPSDAHPAAGISRRKA